MMTLPRLCCFRQSAAFLKLFQHNRCAPATADASRPADVAFIAQPKRPLTTVLTQQVLLADENRKKCIECMQRAPPLGMKMDQHRNESVSAAVLILLCTTKHSKEEVSILYTRRSVQLSRHVRQISFPGGIKDSTDADAIACALRETEEEIGLPRERIQLWGEGTILAPPRTAAITPVVGFVDRLDLAELQLNPAEVEVAFTIPIADLLQPAAIRYTQFKGGYSTPVFVVGTYKVWGVTGFLTNRFLRCLVPRELPLLKRHTRFVRPFKSHRS